MESGTAWVYRTDIYRSRHKRKQKTRTPSPWGKLVIFTASDILLAPAHPRGNIYERLNRNRKKKLGKLWFETDGNTERTARNVTEKTPHRTVWTQVKKRCIHFYTHQWFRARTWDLNCTNFTLEGLTSESLAFEFVLILMTVKFSWSVWNGVFYTFN